jgi:hypothetical protein
MSARKSIAFHLKQHIVECSERKPKLIESLRGRTEKMRHYCRLRFQTGREKDGDGSEEFACLSRIFPYERLAPPKSDSYWWRVYEEAKRGTEQDLGRAQLIKHYNP